jgi:hypothetical protein
MFYSYYWNLEEFSVITLLKARNAKHGINIMGFIIDVIVS